MRLAIVARQKPDKPGSLPLYVRLAHAGVKRSVSLSMRVPAREWTRRSRRCARRARRRSSSAASSPSAWRRAGSHQRARSVGPAFTPDRLKKVAEEAMHPAAPPKEVERPGVLAYGRAVQQGLDERGRVGTALVYGAALNHFDGTIRHVTGKDAAAFGSVDAPLLRMRSGC